MKVHELITALQVMPPNDEVRIVVDEILVAEPRHIAGVYHESDYGKHFVLLTD